MIKKASAWIFEEGDPLPLKTMRIYFGVLVVWQLAWLAGSFDRWLRTPGWILSDCAAARGLLHTDTAAWAVLLLTMVFAAAMAAGVYPRLSAFLTWLGLAVIGATIAPAAGGGELISTYVVFILMFARTKGLCVPLWPQKLILLSLATFYASATLHKLGDRCWLEGSAVYFALQYESFRMWPVPQLLKLPQLSPFLTYSALLAEGLLALLPFLMRWKYPILLLGVVLHAGISYALFIPHFGPAMVGLYFSALKADEMRKVWRSAVERFT